MKQIPPRLSEDARKGDGGSNPLGGTIRPRSSETSRAPASKQEVLGSSPSVGSIFDKPLFYNGRWRHITPEGWVVLEGTVFNISAPLRWLDQAYYMGLLLNASSKKA